MVAFPKRIDLISVPVKTRPAVYCSMSSYSKRAFILYVDLFLHGAKVLYFPRLTCAFLKFKAQLVLLSTAIFITGVLFLSSFSNSLDKGFNNFSCKIRLTGLPPKMGSKLHSANNFTASDGLLNVILVPQSAVLIA